MTRVSGRRRRSSFLRKPNKHIRGESQWTMLDSQRCLPSTAPRRTLKSGESCVHVLARGSPSPRRYPQNVRYVNDLSFGKTRVWSVGRCGSPRYGTVRGRGCGVWRMREALEWETEVGVRVGVRNRLGEAIGKPVANPHGRAGQRRGRAVRKGQKDRAPVSSKATGLFPAREGPRGPLRRARGVDYRLSWS